ncbi:hypothetical protein EMIT0P218_270027 [Pseudomonas sp. IT-P218]
MNRPALGSNTLAGRTVCCTRSGRRCAILLIGGDKTGQERWYTDHVPLAERIFDEHLETLKKEGYENG